MFHLKCFIDGELHKDIEINPGQEIIIGRDDTADIKLDSFPGISREHVKVRHLGDKLVVERISQAGKLVVNGLSEKSIEISGQGQFSIPPYNFETIQEIDELSIPEAVVEDKEEIVTQEKTFAGDFEKTSISSQDLSASFKRIEFGNIVDEFQMDSAKWTFGRAKTCNVFIDHDKASRQHFEVYKLNDKFLIKDLGSSNGTFLNGHQLPANNEIDLKSGDVISIQDYKLVFEIKDKFVEKQIHNLPDYYKPINLGHLANSPTPSSMTNNMGVKKVKESWLNLSNWNRQKKIRVGITILFVIMMGVAALMPTGPSNKSVAQREVAALRQRAEEAKIIENAKIAALQYMDQANWSHCLSEVQRIQDIKADDVEASEIGLRCQTALEKLERQNQMEAQERDRQAIIQKVQVIIEQCRNRVNEGGAAIRDCLQPAIELSPENEEIAKLFDQADMVDRLAEEDKAKRDRYLKSLNAGLSIIKKADNFKDKQYWEEAIKLYNSYIKGGYPDPKSENKNRAKREIASITSALESTLKKALDDAKIQFGRENYKDAVLAARKGLKIDEYNKDLKKIESDALNLLRIEIRSLYQDSILMEDLGKIHTAISKWKQIIERDIPGEDYFQKAEGKLKNYETEI
jgi:pSer/pThr/pTyr-binding forkhead associated (FHA) protein